MDKRKGTEEEGSSVANQLAACRRYIKSQVWTEGKVYQDNSISATTGALRPAFEQMLLDVPPLVVVWKQDRLERPGAKGDLDRFILAGCEGVTVDGERVSFETATSELMTRFKSITAGYETRLKSERQKLRNEADARAGKWHYSRPVFGNDRVTGAIISDEAKAIRTAAAGLVEGNTTFFQISKTWNAQGFRTPVSKGAGGKNWEPGTVRNFFTAPRLIGERVYEGVPYQMKGWEPLLDRDTFEVIQQMIDSAKTGRRGVQGNRNMPHLLTALATCGAEVDGKPCGKGLNVGYRGGKNNTRH